MTVVHPAERAEWWAAPGKPCFYCHNDIPTETPAVEWAGQEHILLHPECADKLGVHLIGDAREARLSGGDRLWTRRVARAARAAMIAQEACPRQLGVLRPDHPYHRVVEMAADLETEDEP